MFHALCAVIGICLGYLSLICARSDISSQRELQNTFGEAHFAEQRITPLFLSAVGAVVMVTYSFRNPSFIAALFVATALFVGLRVSMIDIDTHSIPRRVLFFGTVLISAQLLVGLAVGSDSLHPVSAIVGAAGAWAFMRVVEICSRGDLGHADVTLAGFLGLALGALDAQLIVVAFVLSFVCAGVVAMVLMGTKRMTRTSHIPFGPFLFVGMVLAVLR